MEKYYEDFEGWCAECVRIPDKLTGCPVPFVLNAAQRRLAGIFERERCAGHPIRIILLKARQWGGSTLVQAYMAWMQLVRRIGWNSLICAHVKDAASGIKGMYSMLLRNYPTPLKEGNEKSWGFAPYERSSGVWQVAARECRVAICSAQSPDSLRGGNYFMAHLSEAAFWADGDPKAASAIIRTVSGTVPRVPDSMVVVESTANGRSNWFYTEWKRASAGESDKIPVFVPWHEIEMYRQEIDDEEWRKLEPSLSDYEKGLVNSGISKECVAWYHEKRKEYASDAEMTAEFPTTPEEAFIGSGKAVFPPEERPELVSPDSGGSPSLAVLCPGGGESPSVLTLFGLDEGRVYALSEKKWNMPLISVMDSVALMIRDKKIPLMILDSPDGDGVSHGNWCSQRAARLGINIRICEDDNPYFCMTSDRLSELIDFHHEALRDIKMVEAASVETDIYGIFTRQNAWSCPEMLNRLAAARQMLLYGNEPNLNPSDFRDLIPY